MRQLLFPGDAQFWFETLRVLGHAAYGGSDVGEVLAVTDRITAGDYDSWHDAWLDAADQVAGEAARSQAAGHPVSARDGFLRASTYYRSAEFFLHGAPDDPRIEHAYRRGVDCFHAFARLSDTRIEPVRMPYQGAELHGYFYRAPGVRGPRPTLVLHNGFDGGAEEMHFFGAQAAIERGYHALTFDGPGQPAAIHGDGLVFRPDWENVVGPVLDHLREGYDGEVDPARIGLLGVSLGGMLAPRAAAFDHRIAALIAVDGVCDASSAITDLLAMDRAEVARQLSANDLGLESHITSAARANPTLRWALDHGRYVTGQDSATGFVSAYLDYHLGEGVAERITCPTLVCEAEQDLFFASDGANGSQPRQLYERLRCPKTLLTFTDEEGGNAHCHVGAQRLAMARIFDWLDDALGRRA